LGVGLGVSEGIVVGVGGWVSVGYGVYVGYGVFDGTVDGVGLGCVEQENETGAENWEKKFMSEQLEHVLYAYCT